MSMWLRIVAAFLALSLTCVGCSKDPYQEVINKQVDNWTEMADILVTVKDREGMPEAEQKITSRIRKFQDTSLEAKLLPMPDAAQLSEFEKQRKRMQDAVDRFRMELGRVKALPGGEEFVERITKAVAASQRGSLK